MAVHALADRATAGTRSCCRCCMHRNGHGIGDADLFNDQVGKIGKYRHRLILAQENVSLEILFGPLFYHIAIIEAAEEPRYASQSHLSQKRRFPLEALVKLRGRLARLEARNHLMTCEVYIGRENQR